MKFYLFGEMIIIASRDKEEAEQLYLNEYGDSDYEIVEEISEDYRIGGIASSDGYGDIHLSQVVENRPLPFIVNTDIS